MDENPIELVAKNVDAAAKAILNILRQDTKTTSFWLRGWGGLGASSVLRAIAQLLKSPSCDSSTRNHFGRIIHVDCSMWKSRRGMQKIIAEELGLHELMPLFDKEDEDDDFRGVDESSRGGITNVGKAILQSLVNEKFLIIFQCGIDEDTIPEELSVPLKFGSGKLLWTNCIRFQQFFKNRPGYLKRACVINFAMLPWTMVPLLALREEAVEVAELIRYTGMDGVNPDLVMECYCYLVFLIHQARRKYEGTSTDVDYGWITHACNYWVCDGILQGDTAWKIGDALHGLLLAPLRYDANKIQRADDILRMKKTEGREWISSYSYSLEPPNSCSTSYFLNGFHLQELQTDDSFQRVKKNLHVLKLYNCSFDFSSPPFICCQNLRFLWLDTCTDNSRKEDGVAPPYFPNLWVFDLRFTEYVYFPQVADMMRDLRELNAKGVSWKIISQAWSKLQNIQRLRVAVEPSEVITKDNCSSIDMQSLELLDLSGSTQLRSLPDVSLAEMLKMLVLDGCFSLERVTLERAPMLEIFSFDGYGQAKEWTHSLHLPEQDLHRGSPEGTKAKVSKISLEGCARLQSIFLRALHNLQVLNLSGTAIKRLDLDAMDVPGLKSLFLLGCEKLKSLLWKGYRPKLDVLHVDTTTRETARSVMCCGEEENLKIVAEVTFLDGRFVWSALTGVVGVNYRMGFHVHLHILDPSMDINFAEDTSPDNGDYVETGPFLGPYTDIDFPVDGGLLWDDFLQPKLLETHLEIGQGSHNLDSMQDDLSFRTFTKTTKSLYVHDNSSITVIPPSPTELYPNLEWCLVHRCPKLQTLFICPTHLLYYTIFPRLVWFAAIDLQMAHCIWGTGWGRSFGIETKSIHLARLQHLYLHNCPRLVHVLPVFFHLTRLETIQIQRCGNLKCVFPLDDKYPEEVAARVEFLNLKHIKLQYLHTMENICGSRVLYAPKLETVSVTDCWGLRRLPAISDQHNQRPVVQCEEDWWNKLEWDGLKANHHPSRFETRHSRYYKKTILRASVLR